MPSIVLNPPDDSPTYATASGGSGSSLAARTALLPAPGDRCPRGTVPRRVRSQVVDAGRDVDDRRLGRQPLVVVGVVRAASGAGALCAEKAGAGGVRRAARSTPMTAPMSHTAKATDAMPPLQKPVTDRPATA